MKIVNRNISIKREKNIISSPNFKVEFKNKSLFKKLRITITRERTNETRVFEIESKDLPDNKSNTTYFKFIDEGNGLYIKWSGKVEDFIKEI